jgi:hypothetical protein
VLGNTSRYGVFPSAKKIDKIPNLENIEEASLNSFWELVKDPSISAELAYSKIPDNVQRVIGYQLASFPPIINGNQVSNNDCMTWYSKPHLTKKVIEYLVNCNKTRQRPVDTLTEAIRKVVVTCDLNNSDSVAQTLLSVTTHLLDDKLPPIVKEPHHQKRMVSELYRKLLQSTSQEIYDMLLTRMLDLGEIVTVSQWLHMYNVAMTLAIQDQKM